MKIGFVLDDTLDTNDGVQQYVLLVGEWLRGQGHEVHYLVGETNSRRMVENLHSLSKNIQVAFNKNRLSIPIRVDKKRLRLLMNREQWDVLHVQMPYSPFLSGRVIALASPNTAIVATFHIAPHGKSVQYGSRFLGSLSKKTVSRITRVISVSRVAQIFAINTYGIVSTVIPNAINMAAWQSPQTVPKHTTICFMGRLVKRKGCHLLLEALAILNQQKKLKGIHVTIAGDGPERKKLESFVTNNDLRDIVVFKGYVSENQKKETLSTSKITVLPATGGESFGIVLLEAMASGSVVLAGDNPGYRGVLGAIPESIVGLSPSVIAQKINILLHDQKRLQALKKKQQKLVRNYDINSVGSGILNVYKEAIKQVLQDT